MELTATRWYGSDTHANNGMNTGKLNCIHDTWPNIGATTRYIYGLLIILQQLLICLEHGH